jgi:hypothetical protein
MFTIERTQLRSSFGFPLEEVIDYIKMWDAEHSNEQYDSLLLEVTGCSSPEELLNENPYATKIIAQHPEYQNAIGQHRNYSEEAFYRARMQGDYIEEPSFEFAFEKTIGYAGFKTIDTYLQQIVRHDLVDFKSLSSNPRAVSYLLKHPDLVCWKAFSSNPNSTAIYYLEDHPELIDFENLSKNTNPKAIAILRANLERINWKWLSVNPCDEAVTILLENPERIFYPWMAKNRNPRAVEFLKEHPDRINWRSFSQNPCPAAVEFLAANWENIHWGAFCVSARTRQQFDLLREHLECVDWTNLCMNPSEYAVALLEENPTRIVWHYSLLYQNMFETITTYDYEGIRGKLEDPRTMVRAELQAWASHPTKMATKWKDWGFDNYGMDDESDEELKEVLSKMEPFKF